MNIQQRLKKWWQPLPYYDLGLKKGDIITLEGAGRYNGRTLQITSTPKPINRLWLWKWKLKNLWDTRKWL